MAKLLSENRKYRMQINAAYTVFKKRDIGQIEKKFQTDKKTGLVNEFIIDEDEVQDREFAVQFFGTTVEEKILDQALGNLCNVIKEEMRKKGLIRA